jgi:hypothetical protein
MWKRGRSILFRWRFKAAAVLLVVGLGWLAQYFYFHIP